MEHCGITTLRELRLQRKDPVVLRPDRPPRSIMRRIGPDTVWVLNCRLHHPVEPLRSSVSYCSVRGALFPMPELMDDTHRRRTADHLAPRA